MKPAAIIHHLISRVIGLLVMGALLPIGNLFAAGSAVEGLIKDANGRPIGGAEVRIEARKGAGAGTLVRSDARGRYIYDGLAAGVTYRVTLLINGAVKASINNVLAKTGSTQLNFDLRTSSVSGNRIVSNSGKRYVYIPAE